jgi:hypothetical protein
MRSNSNDREIISVDDCRRSGCKTRILLDGYDRAPVREIVPCIGDNNNFEESRAGLGPRVATSFECYSQEQVAAVVARLCSETSRVFARQLNCIFQSLGLVHVSQIEMHL